MVARLHEAIGELRCGLVGAAMQRLSYLDDRRPAELAPSVSDAVICGFGRLGNWFGLERWGRRAGHRHRREGPDERLPPALGSPRQPEGAGAVLETGTDLMLRHAYLFGARHILPRRPRQHRHPATREPPRQGARYPGRHGRAAATAGPRTSTSASSAPQSVPRAAIELPEDLHSARPAAPAEIARLVPRAGVIGRPLATEQGIPPPLIITECALKLVVEQVTQVLERYPA